MNAFCFFLINDRNTGLFHRKVALHNGSQLGSKVGWTSKKGYIAICIDRRDYQAHRLAWFYVTREWPSQLIDHKDRNPSNNRFDNLRLASPLQNAWNSKVHCTNTSGVRGVSFDRQHGKWHAYIGYAPRTNLGLFSSFEEAVVVRQKAESTLIKSLWS